MSSHPPLIEVAIEPQTESDAERLALALSALAAEDSAFRFWTDRESGQTIIGGMGEFHLDCKLDILKRTYKVELYIAAPQIAYRETISRQVTKDYTHKKQAGGSGQFARLKIVCEPLPPGSGFMFENKAVGGNVPKEYVPGVEKGLESVLGSGVLAGFPVVDLKVTLIDGAYHDVDSSALAFEIASRAALKEALREAGPVLLEPIMRVEVLTPQEHAGAVIADLQTRRGKVQDQNTRGDSARIDAIVPLVALFGYRNNLRALSGGLATFEMRYSHYAPVPRALPGDDEPFPLRSECVRSG
jgi:elongation factor G